MATPSELSLEEIRNYLLENGGTARNHDLVKHFKRFLTDPETRVEARNRFKEYVNTLATIKNEEGEKYLVLKKKYRQPFLDLSPPKQVGSPLATSNLTTPVSPLREPPPYRPPPPAPLSPSSSNSHVSLEESATPISTREKNDDSEPSSSMSPPVPPRRKSQDKLKVENKENVDRNRNSSLEAVIKEDEAVTTTNSSSAEQLSVRERMQRFNRMASETDLHVRHNDTTVPVRKRTDKGADEDDSASVASQLDGKSREWLVRASQGDYQALAKLAAEEPRLTRLKDPTSGGYTPLHIAMQFGHENIFNLLVQVYGANQDVRDYSGRKARQYLASQEAAVSQDTFHKIKARKKHAEKDLGFLRIGSLNVRVKRTTEAFSQFLGVATSSTTNNNNNEKIHKSWGSADNVQLEQKLMPPPKYAPIKKRRSRRPQDFGSSQERQQVASQPTTPLLQGKMSRSSRTVQRRPTSTTSINSNSIASGSVQQNGDSDSDTTCGFDSAWRGSAQL
ncbi:PREDICTED: ankyrin repeat domain-containing protein SOWAHB isoform X3 [Trachymyrmex septentrionalis]|uniref:ankyrin repeat domain-containing protein SOWAHB isoform X3 n=1 Tax=Trachymyrmex septentrionalis TaxID=34720 RepID=UPI00084F6198|nr:PREDICTED: ankyrin repeat domain-containing protein SOWAHB isoform X3 [Trachymyrmex septentrionalis]